MLATSPEDQASAALQSTWTQLVNLVASNDTLKWLVVVVIVALIASVAVKALGSTMRIVIRGAALVAAIWLGLYLFFSLS